MILERFGYDRHGDVRECKTTLQKDALHGWAISERVQHISEDVLQINQGSLYPALHRLEHQGWIEAEWKVSELGRRAKYYRLTAAGKAQLSRERDRWSQLVNAIGRIMNPAPASKE